MPAAPLPPDEKQRLEVLERYAILDTLPEQQYDDLTLLAAQICQTPISLISLVANERQWFKSRVGIGASETSRDLSFCAHAILQEGVFEVPDASQDARFSSNALVTAPPAIRFYAGAPLTTPDGFRLGTLCVIDSKPRKLEPAQIRALEALSRQVVSQMELWRTIKRLEIADVEKQIVLNTLRQSDARFTQFMDNSPLMAFIKDAEGRFLFFNRPMERQFEISLAQLSGKTDFDWLPPDVAQTVRNNDLHVLQTREISQLVETVPTPDGQNREWLVFKFPICDGTGRCDLGGVALDITERLRVEKLKDDFISAVSHELRTPLTSIRGALGLIVGGVAGDLAPEVAQMLDIAYRNAQRLGALIDDILDIQKIERGFALEKQPVSLTSLLRRAVEDNRAYATALSVTLRLELPDGITNARVIGDEGRLQQVLANLISNACKYTPQEGEVLVRLVYPSSDFGQSKTKKGSVWRIEVEDGGSGVQPEFVPRLFQKFAQAETSATRRHGGTGLGLAIARAIVERHGGFIEYCAPGTRGNGPVFAFELPGRENLDGGERGGE